MTEAFCTSCGKPLRDGAAFCGNCGAPVESRPARPENSSSPGPAPLDYFSEGSHTELRIRRYAWKAIGILYTDTSALRAVYGDQAAVIVGSIRKHAEESAKRGMLYFILDSARNRIGIVEKGGLDEYVDLLARAIDDLKQKLVDVHAVFIIGGHDVIPMGVFTNPAGDRDEDVESDLPYSTLVPADPADDPSAPLDGRILVGRLPLGPGSDPVDAKNYFTNISKVYNGEVSLEGTFGLSAKVWEGASRAVYQDISGGELLLSPSVTLDNIDKFLKKDAALHYFNLHGSDEAEFLYGQQDFSYPETFSPREAADLSSLNVIGNEACYGARFIGLEKNESILLSAFSNRTVAMAASSRIAFGPADPPPSLADIIVGGFIQGIKTGQFAGEALALAKRKVLEDPDLDEPGVKTVLEFNLFGDPLLLLTRSRRTIYVPVPRLEVRLPDIRVELLAAMESVNEKIRNAMESRVRERHPGFAGKTPKAASIFMKRTGRKFTRFTFDEKLGKFKNVLILYLDDRANVTKEYVSK